MDIKNQADAVTRGTTITYHKGQRVVYEGDVAEIIAVSPILTIRLSGKIKLICGNILYKKIEKII